MKVNKNIINKPHILYDGPMFEIDKEFKIIIGRESLFFRISDIVSNSFQNLYQKISENDIKKIIQEGEIKNNVPDYFIKHLSIEEYNKLLSTMQYYKAESHLGLNYLIKDNFLLLFTYGEKQPSRWIFVLEGVWEIA